MKFEEMENIRNRIRREIADCDLDFDIENLLIKPDKEKKIKDFYEKSDKFKNSRIAAETPVSRQMLSFIAAAFLIFLLVPSAAFMNKGIVLKKELENTGVSAYKNLVFAQNSIFSSRFANAKISFKDAYKNFLDAESETKKMGGAVLAIFSNFPGFKKISAGENLLKVGKHLSSAGMEISDSLEGLSRIFSDTVFDISFDKSLNAGSDINKIFNKSVDNLVSAKRDLISAKSSLDKVEIDSLPKNFKDSALSLKERLPFVIESLDNIEYYSNIINKILGNDNERKYLFLFQNPSEIRATGGFIGSYALIDVFKGKIKKVFVDDIFNPDGQLKEKIIPPNPIKRVSTAWSTHDANWFFDFQDSAEKISWFYEKTGGPTPDGIVALTANFVEDVLKITGPISMEDYGLDITADNFVEEFQREVEMGANKELNKPKKIIKDFMPKLIDRVSVLNKSEGLKILNIVLKNLESKDLMFYSYFDEIQNFIVSEGWGGKIIATDQDYLAVVHSNLNGFKTDRVIEEKINHVSGIDQSGNIVNTVTVRRFHNGGNYKYDYWNKVNVDYLRVYVPEGSQLIYAKGFTKDKIKDPIDYQKSGFKIDGDVAEIERTLRHKEEFAADIFEESGKTVFGGWVFLSPKETVAIEIKYVLPFKFDFNNKTQSHSVFVQKQSGLKNINFESMIKLPDFMKVAWNYPSDLKIKNNNVYFSADLNRDYFFGVVLDAEIK